MRNAWPPLEFRALLWVSEASIARWEKGFGEECNLEVAEVLYKQL